MPWPAAIWPAAKAGLSWYTKAALGAGAITLGRRAANGLYNYATGYRPMRRSTYYRTPLYNRPGGGRYRKRGPYGTYSRRKIGAIANGAEMKYHEYSYIGAVPKAATGAGGGGMTIITQGNGGDQRIGSRVRIVKIICNFRYVIKSTASVEWEDATVNYPAQHTDIEGNTDQLQYDDANNNDGVDTGDTTVWQPTDNYQQQIANLFAQEDTKVNLKLPAVNGIWIKSIIGFEKAPEFDRPPFYNEIFALRDLGAVAPFNGEVGVTTTFRNKDRASRYIIARSKTTYLDINHPQQSFSFKYTPRRPIVVKYQRDGGGSGLWAVVEKNALFNGIWANTDGAFVDFLCTVWYVDY